MKLEVTSDGIARMLAHAARDAPREACGLLLGQAGRIAEARAAANVHPQPETRFEIDPAALIAAHRAQRGGAAVLIGYYHSHPSGPPEPSATDRAMAQGDGKVWAITAGGEVRFWLDGPAGFVELPVEMTSP